MCKIFQNGIETKMIDEVVYVFFFCIVLDPLCLQTALEPYTMRVQQVPVRHKDTCPPRAFGNH